MYYDMHVHSTFSTDSELEMEKGILRAIELGLTGIAFTDHLEIDYIDHEEEFQYDFQEYFRTVEAFRDKYASRLDILTAVEIGLQPHVIEATKQRIAGLHFDYKIGSTHLIKRRDPYYGTYFKKGVSKKEAYDEYLEELLGNLRLYHDFSTLGHLDYIVRYANFPDSRFYYRDHAELVDEIFRFIIAKDISFEINTSTYRRQPLDRMLLLRYKELGGKLVTIGSDAHGADRIAENFSYYLEIIKDCGFPYIIHYKDGLPLQEPIR